MELKDKLVYIAACGAVLILLAVVLSSQTDLGYNPEPPEGLPGAYMSVKPVVHNMGPGEMMAVVLTVENNDAQGRDLYYGFGFEGFGSDSGTKRTEFVKWITTNDGFISIPYEGVGYKDAVVSVPRDATLGEYVFNAYSCYSETPDDLNGCGRASSNIWATLQITIRVID